MKINNLEKFKAKAALGETCLGIVTTSYDAAVAELAGDAGMDFIWIDEEHSPLNQTDVLHQVMAVRGTDCAPFVRVPWSVNWLLKPVLDMAPAGVIVPMVNDAETARAVVKSCRYPMQGGERGLGTRRANGYGAMPMDDYWKASESEPMIIFQIEHRDAVENLDEILAVPGWDSVCIGPFDLSTSFCKPGQFDAPEVQEALNAICVKTRKAGKMLGGFLAPDFPLEHRLDWRVLGTDMGLLAAGIKAAEAAARSDGISKSET